MEENKFSTIMYGNYYVDAGKLSKGIYTCFIPFLYEEGKAKETILKNTREFGPLVGFSSEQINAVAENLAECTEVDVELSITNTTKQDNP